MGNLIVHDVSPRFRNDNGFVEQAGVRRVEAEVVRRWGEVSSPAQPPTPIRAGNRARPDRHPAPASGRLVGGPTEWRGLDAGAA